MKILELLKKDKKNGCTINILNRVQLTKNQKEQISKVVMEQINLGKSFKDISIYLSSKFNLGIVQIYPYHQGNRIDIVI